MKTFAAVLALLLLSAPAAAQPRQERRFLSVNAGAQVASPGLRDSFTYRLHAEDAAVEAEYPGKAALLFDGSAGMRVWRRYGVALAVSRASASGAAQVSARVPHPLYDDQHRAVQGEASAISRTETAVHLQVYYDLQPRGRWRVRLFAGPSFFDVEQEIIEGVEVDESYPYDTAEFRRASTRRADGSGPGLHAGADIGWMFSRRIAFGALLRYARASVDLDAEGSRSVASDGGGLHVGGGLRFVF